MVVAFSTRRLCPARTASVARHHWRPHSRPARETGAKPDRRQQASRKSRRKRRWQGVGDACDRGSASLEQGLNSSTPTPTCRMMARSVPVSSSRWLGTTVWLKGSSRRKMIWLPCWRRTRKPSFCNAATACAPETRGSLLISRRAMLRNVLAAQAGHLPEEPGQSPRWLP